jgi:hypothetical protein
VILGLAIGGCLEAFAGLRTASLFGVLLGMVAANFVPRDSRGCDT